MSRCTPLAAASRLVSPSSPRWCCSEAAARGAVLGEDERIDVRRALRAVTIDAGWQHFEESEKGSIEVGKLADLVVLDRSPLDDPASLDRIPVRTTVVGGREIFAGAP